MTEEEIFAKCDGYMTVSDDNYRDYYVYKEKDGQYLYPFYKHRIRIDSEMPTVVNLLYSRKLLTD